MKDALKKCPLCNKSSFSLICDCGYSFQIGAIPKDDKKSREKIIRWYKSSSDWFEELQKLKKIHDIQVEKYGDPLDPRIYGPDGWRQQDTAKLLGYRSHTSISDKLKRARQILKYPYLKTFSSLSEARRHIDSGGSLAEFEFEDELQIRLQADWHTTPFGDDWELIGDGKYDTKEVGIIDLLATSKRTSELLVIELKAHRSSDVAVGQLLRYMGWVKHKLATETQSVRGLIISRIPDLHFMYALSCTSSIEFYVYDLKDGNLRFIKLHPTRS